MKNILLPICAGLILGLSAFTFKYATSTKIGSGYSIAFSSEDASGIFAKMKGDVTFDPANTAISKFNLSIEVSSINTGNGLKNKHAKADNWFDAKKYPRIEFVSSNVGKTGNTYEAKGMLTMHGVSKEITIPFTYEPTSVGGNVKAAFDVDRMDYKVGEEEKKVSKVIHIDALIPVTK